MMKKIKALLKNQKGFTLVELLAVIVILGIIGAIAVPSIAGIIDNSKKDAHVANAQQMVGAARLAVAANDVTFTSGTATLTLQNLEDQGYIEKDLKDPDGGSGYNFTTSKVVITKTPSSAAIQDNPTTTGVNEAATAKSESVTYSVTLIGANRSITNISPSDLTRTNVVKNN